MTDLTREQFATAVEATVSSIYHLYREVDRLIVGLREALSEPPEPLVPIPATLSKAGRDPARLTVRNEYGALFWPPSRDEEDVDEEDEDLEEGEEEGDEEVSTSPKKHHPAEIVADQSVLAVRVVLYDPREPKGFEPQLLFAVMDDWRVGTKEPAAGARLTLARYMMRRIPRALGPGASRTRVVTRGRRCAALRR